MEIAPAYVDVAVRRWQELTGKEATLDGGKTWREVAAARGVKIPDTKEPAPKVQKPKKGKKP